eukprot:CAMPEP_0182418568 /NCGR_PEP_ID=MMETSP1167-20130531/2947_1 /TAXON_ID=2988 /ORGANISM="Mallomonas Sp, Strain CCMP3275" /LENGTH=247 /DNA_ID=CAMNT_0024592833 /DNA_START=337 /DNA_END=1080 /DNA_ORIENTATION=-
MVDHMPVPPPYKIVVKQSGIVYVNDITEEESESHPLEKIASLFQSVPDETENSTIDVSELETPKNYQYMEYRCQWQEKDLLGRSMVFGLLIRFFPEDSHVELKFDGIPGEWVYSYLEGLYGPVTQYDLFIGARVKLFGRYISIQSCNAAAARWIEKTAREMKDRIRWMQDRIENNGAKPVVLRRTETVARHVVRELKGDTYENLRRLQLNLAKLGEQLVDLGLSHLLLAGESEMRGKRERERERERE